eukprot:TRINITY_DN62034_c0_g5_i1.p1 TRINITY_DN62034_c0_g5~~TRINITY_DN62034_c0_g5_i1.p1  ORF type:complete len:189 (-),score=19.98 TRINITY_DN62034_c0_g5_i1:231-797(-)
MASKVTTFLVLAFTMGCDAWYGQCNDLLKALPNGTYFQTTAGLNAPDGYNPQKDGVGTLTWNITWSAKHELYDCFADTAYVGVSPGTDYDTDCICYFDNLVDCSTDNTGTGYVVTFVGQCENNGGFFAHHRPVSMLNVHLVEDKTCSPTKTVLKTPTTHIYDSRPSSARLGASFGEWFLLTFNLCVGN